MGLVTKFEDSSEIFLSVPGCPLASASPDVALAACATCGFNIVFRGQPRVGCAQRTDPDLLKAALQQLEARSPELFKELTAALEGDARVGPDTPTRLATLRGAAERWVALMDSQAKPAEHAVSQTLADFTRAAHELGRAIVVLD